MYYLIDRNNNVIASSEEDIFVPEDSEKIVESDIGVVNVDRVKYENGKVKKKNMPPNSSTVFRLFQEKFVEWEGSLDAGLDRMDKLLNTYPTADRAISQGNYDVAKNRINKAVKNSNLALTSQEAQTLTDILDGKVK